MLSTRLSDGSALLEESVVAMFVPYHFSIDRDLGDDGSNNDNLSLPVSLSICPLLCFLQNNAFGCRKNKIKQIVNNRAPYWGKSQLSYSVLPFAYNHTIAPTNPCGTNSQTPAEKNEGRDMAYLLSNKRMEGTQCAIEENNVRFVHPGSKMYELNESDF